MIRVILIVLFACLSFSNTLQAQEETTTDLDSLSWEELTSKGGLLIGEYKFSEAEQYLKKALEVAEEQDGKRGKKYWYPLTCRALGRLYSTQGAYEKAESFLLEAIETIVKDHKEYALACIEIAGVYEKRGFYKRVEDFYQKALSMIKEHFGVSDGHYNLCLMRLGRFYRTTGRYRKAEELYLESKTYIGKDHEMYPYLSNRLATLYYEQGVYKKAQVLWKEVLEIFEQQFGNEDPNYALIANNLAAVYAEQGLYEKSHPIYLEAKAIQEKVVGKEHPNYALACHSLGTSYVDKEQYEKAESLYQEAKKIYEKALGKNSEDYLLVCEGLGSLYAYKGEYQKAERLYLEVKSKQAELLGTDHPSYNTACHNLATLYEQQDRYEEAKALFEVVIAKKENEVKRLFPLLSESERQAFIKNKENFFTSFTDFAVRYYPQDRTISRELFDQRLFTKGMIFASTQKIKARILSSNDSSLINQYESWKKQKEEYVALIQTPLADRDSTINLTEIASQINELEKEISKKSEDFRQSTDQLAYTWQDVRKTLSKKEAVVEIIRLLRSDLKNKPTDTVYVALILTAKTKKSPELVVLGNGNELDNAAFRFYRNSIEYQLEDANSYRQYWKPVEDKLTSLSRKGYSKIYFSPDGVYYKLNLNTLLNPETGNYLVEEQSLQLITSSRDLLERETAGLDKNYEAYQAYLLGYPSYKLSLDTEETDTLQSTDKDRSLSSLQGILEGQTAVPVLEGTKVETDQIKELLITKGISTTLFQNEAATEENIKALQDPTILHFATHGFFISPPQSTQTETMQEAETRSLLENPFLRSGLLLAGCQSPQLSKGDDGILSAEEAMNLNLDKTELVVLSACETGLGDVQDGEGVYGLQRAFRQAGASTLLMSLWKVSDEATQRLMVAFYEALLSGKSKREAFKVAQLKLKEAYPEPYYWGAFVMVGE